MKRLILLCGLAMASSASVSHSNPWSILEGSTLLDGTESASYVAGYMFSGREWEYTSSQISLRCADGNLQMHIVGDSDLIRFEAAEENPTVEFLVQAGSDLTSFKASVNPESIQLEKARIHEGASLVRFLAKHDGSSARVQLPLAKTGGAEVRELSLEDFKATTEVIINTCGPIAQWQPPQPEASPAIQPIDDAELDFETALAIGIVQQVVETLILEQGVSYEQIIEALGKLVDE